MCLTCGCGDEAGVRVLTVDGAQENGHTHGHDHGHHGHDHGGLTDAEHARLHETETETETETMVIEQAILAKNDHLAEHNRAWLAARDIVALNLMSSPGSGKTSLLERTIAELSGNRPICVIEGDQETTFDADRIRAAGARAVQVNTGAGCHLDAPMVQRAIEALDPTPGSLLFVENVGNLVCPALFDIGERAKVVIISVTEGQDKPLKYPHMFATADLVVVNKTDLLPYVDFDVETFTVYARSLNPGVRVLPLSAKTGAGIDGWYAWLAERAPLGFPSSDLAAPRERAMFD
jgi:hydrogenase nickel incorporation protein HypB